MASQLWTPAKATTLPRAEVPTSDVRLSDGRLMRRVDAMTCDVGGGVLQTQYLFLTKQGSKGLRVIASMDDTHHGRLLHVSLSYGNHLPTWDDVRAVRDAFFPDSVDVMMVLPRSQDYVNVHEYCFHLQQTPVGWGLQ